MAYLRQCNDCDAVYRAEKKNNKYCDRCGALREALRVSKIKIKEHERLLAFHSEAFVKYTEQHKRITNNDR